MTKVPAGTPVVSIKNLIALKPLEPSSYAYAIDAKDYNVPAFIFDAQQHKIVVASAFKPFSTKENKDFSYGSLMIPVASQKLSEKEVHVVLKKITSKTWASSP